jgi:transcriptional regulator with XRE-family HTH domain
MAMPHKIGQRIRDVRIHQQLTQAQLASKIGVSYQLIQDYEQGKKLTIDRFLAIAEALHVDPQILIVGSPPRKTLAVPSKLGFYGRPADSKAVDADAEVKAACGLPRAWENHWYDRIHPDDRAQVDHELRRLHDPSDGVFAMQYRLIGLDGVERKIIDYGRMIFDGDKPLRLQGMMLDITDERGIAVADNFRSAFPSLSREKSRRLRTAVAALCGAAMFLSMACAHGYMDDDVKMCEFLHWMLHPDNAPQSLRIT